MTNFKLTSGQATEISIDSTTLLNPTSSKTVRYYARDGISDLFDELIDDQFIDDQEKNEGCYNIAFDYQKKKKGYYNIALIGNPGSGKSNLAYAAAEFLAFHNKTPVLWVGRRFRSQEWVVRSFVPSEGETNGCVEILSPTYTNLEDILRLERAQRAEVLVLDAPTRSDDESSGDGAAAFVWAGYLQRFGKRRVIHVSSLGGFAPKQTVRDECRLREIQMRIWTRNDFVKSLEDADLKKQLCDTLVGQDVDKMTNEELVDMKFFFSGINARWFFNTKIHDIKDECREIIARLQQGSIDAGTKAEQAINSFQTTIKSAERSIKVFTSSYLAQLAGAESTYREKFLSLFPLVKNYLGNGAPGEIFECDFMMHLQQSHNLADAQVAIMGERAQQVYVNLGVDEGGNRLEWATGVLRSLPKATSDEVVPQSTGLTASALKRVPQWFIPEDNSQAFLDFMVLVPLETGTSWQLKVIQNTVGKRHSADTEKLCRIVRGLLKDGFALDNNIVLAYVIEDRAKSNKIASHLNGKKLKMQNLGDSDQVFTLKVLHPVYKRTATAPK